MMNSRITCSSCLQNTCITAYQSGNEMVLIWKELYLQYVTVTRNILQTNVLWEKEVYFLQNNQSAKSK